MVKTVPDPDPQAVQRFLSAIPHPGRQADAVALDRLFQTVTGASPQLWGGSILGYGHYDYTYATGTGGRWLATGFSPRKAHQVIYIMPGYANFEPILDRLGKWKKGKSCLYVTRLSVIDPEVLAELIRAGLRDLEMQWPISMTPRVT
ncbi:DUF1801 domain-containing protein [Loktanella sp. DJP18]|uniref:DUF1801 domain-containing protein n=1 Tax=Loktanella sp. DJP18 TaxID=3409788 RepID=UPI003BB63E41